MYHRVTRLFPCVAGLLLAVSSAVAASDGDVKTGKLVYERYCISCHGAQGNGQGEAAEYMTIKPRDYRQGTYKWRTTPSGSLPLDSDLEHTLLNGFYGTYMPHWDAIDDRSRRDVIAYIKTFSPRFATEKPQEPIAISADPGYSDESVRRGAAAYKKYNCAQCHGAGGQGDGPSAHELKDDWGNNLVPYDLTKGHVKCGDKSTDIYRVFMAGLSGTPMPTFADSLSPADAWDLVHFIESLSPGYARTYAAGMSGAPAAGATQ
ncbi:MAG: cytochrome c [Pseudomonadota bacterium]|nr:cytochrome c [Pseudomonadota bacterium]